MSTRPVIILAQLAEGTLGLKTIDSPFPEDSLEGGIPSVRFRPKVPFPVCLHGRALNGEAGATGMGVHTHRSRDHPISSPVFLD